MTIAFLRLFILGPQILCVCCGVRACRIAAAWAPLTPKLISSVKLRPFVRLFVVFSPFFQKSVATLRPFVAFTRLFSRFCCQPSLNRHHSAAVWLFFFALVLSFLFLVSSWLPLVAQMASRRGPPHIWLSKIVNGVFFVLQT